MTTYIAIPTPDKPLLNCILDFYEQGRIGKVYDADNAAEQAVRDNMAAQIRRSDPPATVARMLELGYDPDVDIDDTLRSLRESRHRRRGL